MTLRLVSALIEPRPNGFELPTSEFGRFLTHVHGDNGSGKTAVMCAVYWVLGGARILEEPLWSQCMGARLNLVDVNGRHVTLFRAFSDQFDATIEIDAVVTRYEGEEGKWSNEVLPMLGITPREWSAKGGGIAATYLSVVLPAFAVDQDKGWILPYSPFANRQFIEDQPQEVVRLLLGLPQRHDPERDAQRRKLEEEIDRLERAVNARSRALESLAKSLPSKIDAPERMVASRDRLLGELKQFDSVVGSMAEIDASLRQRVESASLSREAATQDLASARQRRNVLQKLIDEGHADLELIGTNEVAANAFRRFCGNENCQFFAGNAEPNSYGRRVLYLRDQFKDIVSAMDAVDGVLASASRRLAEADAHLLRARSEYEAAARAKVTDRVVAAVDGVTRELANLSRTIALSDELAAERTVCNQLTEQRNRVHNDVTNHDQADIRQRKSVAAAATVLRAAITRWMTVLNANEVGAIGVDDDLRVTVGGKVLSDSRGPSGSSRLRLILAYHAALLETSFEVDGDHPPLLLFDAPKQHELNPQDFAAYLAELRRVFAGKSVQIVMSSRTDVPIEDSDAIWSPMFPGDKHPWFLGRVVAPER